MPSKIDATKPTNEKGYAGDLRANLQAAKTAIDELRVSPTDFGAIGDGETDNSAALIAMREWMRARPEALHRVVFPAGQFDYTNNRWLFGVQRVHLIGQGTRLRNTSESSWDANARPFDLKTPFHTSGDVPRSPSDTFATGQLIHTVAAGASEVQLVDPADMSVFEAGGRVLIHGYNQQAGGFPPNMRYFDWRVIDQVDAANRILSLTTPLDWPYDERWHDWTIDLSASTISFGAPRIVALERADYTHARLIIIEHFELLPNPTQGGLALQTPGDDVRYTGLGAWRIDPTVSRSTLIERCRIDFTVECDKLCDEIVIDGTTINGRLRAATGVNRLTVRNSKWRENSDAQPRHATYESCEINLGVDADEFGAITNHGSWPMEVLSLRDTRVLDPAAALEHLVNDGVDATLVVDGVGPGNAIRVEWQKAGDPEWTTNGQQVAGALARGNLVRNDADTNQGRVTAIWQDGKPDGDLIIEGTWPDPPEVGETWRWRPIQLVVDGGGNYVVERWDVPLFRVGAQI